MTTNPASDLVTANAIGTAVPRRDAAEKIRGTAAYADESPAADPRYARIVSSTVARGRIRSVHTAAALAVPGVLAVLTPDNAERHADREDVELTVLQHHDVAFHGQIVAIVVAGTDEAAREAADLVVVDYEVLPADAAFGPDRTDLYAPEQVNPFYDTDTDDGDLDAAMHAAAATVDETYTTPMYHCNPMEPHATTALWQELWQDRRLTVWDSTQSVYSVRQALGTVFGLEPDQVRVICPYVGGGFGSKGRTHAHVVAAVMAAKAVPGHPVRLPLTRQQMFALTGYRTPTVQRVRVAADRDGQLLGIGHDVVELTSRIKEFAEQTAVATRRMYATPNRCTSHRLAALDLPIPSWMRAPGEAPGMFGPEVALDELAHELGVDPVQLRIRNEPELDPDSGKPWSSRNLVACLRDGAHRFGWAGRDPRPRQQRDGDWWVGTGVASSIYPTMRMPVSTASVHHLGGRYQGRIAAADLGTGSRTVLAQILADALAEPVGSVEVLIGDTDLPVASVAGGSTGTSTWGSALVAAAREFRDKFGTDPEDGAEAQGSVPANDHAEVYAMAAFGAQFAEVRVHRDTGEVRVPRLTGVFAAGRIINPVTARSQLLGGMTMGLGMALCERSVLDPRTGHVVNHDLAGYHIPVDADVADLRAYWVDEYDPYVNAMGAKGIGEIGIVGTAAAVANAAWHATGVRVRDLPVSLDHFLG